MSDIGGIFGPFDLVVIFLMIGAPGIALGGTAGVLLWRGHRIAGGLIGAAVGFALWLAGWLWFSGAG